MPRSTPTRFSTTKGNLHQKSILKLEGKELMALAIVPLPFFFETQMRDWIILFFMFFIVAWMTMSYFQPKIEFVQLVKKYRVYLWYNEWEGQHCRRKQRYLFEI